MSKQNTRTTIDANIKQNGQQQITGAILNSVLNTMVTDYAEQEKLTDLELKSISFTSSKSIDILGEGRLIKGWVTPGGAMGFNDSSSESYIVSCDFDLVRITAGDDSVYFVFVKTDSTSDGWDTIGTTRSVVPANTSVWYSVPKNAKAIVIGSRPNAQTAAGRYLPSAIEFYTTTERETEDRMKLAQRVNILGGRYWSDIELHPSSFPKLQKTLNNSSLWQSQVAYCSSLIALNGANEVTVVANDRFDAVYSFVTDDNSEVGSSAHYAEGYTSWRNYVTKGTAQTIEVPSDAKYLYIYLNSATSIYTPTKIFLRTYTELGNFSKYATRYHSEEDALKNKIRDNIDDNTLVFALATDTHISTAFPHTLEYAKILRKLSERNGVDFACNLGDMIQETDDYVHYNPQNNTERVDAFMSELCDSPIPFVYAIGHHELYTSASLVMGYPKSMVFGKAGKYARHFETHHGANKCNFFYDVELQKIRCIFLDSVYQKWGFDADTIAFLETTLSSIPTGYKVLIFSHVPCLTEASFNPTVNEVVNGEAIRNVINGFIDNGGKVLAYIHGHTHADNIVLPNQSLGIKFPLISTACGRNYPNGGISASQKPSVGNPVIYADRNEGTINEYCFDVFCVHQDTEIIDIFRFGCGDDRTISVGNLLPNAEIKRYWLTASGYGDNNTYSSHYAINVEGLSKVRIVGQESKAIVYVLVKSDSSVLGASYDLASGEYGRHVVNAPAEAEVTIPSDAKYLLVGKIANDGQDFSPLSVSVI